MKNKKLFSILSLVFASTLVLGGCNTKPVVSSSVESEESSSVSSSSSEKEKEKYTVNFVVEGTTVLTKQVEEGELAVFDGVTPTKSGAPEGLEYHFRGWGLEYEEPITKNTTFNGSFGLYKAGGYVIDDFEDDINVHDLEDAGWEALHYKNGQWTPDDAKNTISIGRKSDECNKCLRFDSWGNGVGYMFVKNVGEGEYEYGASGIRFRLMTPSFNQVKVILLGAAEIGGQMMQPKFTYIINPTSSEYVEYTIPFDDDGWMLWDEPGKTIKTVAGYTGFHQDDVIKYLTKIEFFIQGNDNNGGQPMLSFLDSASFVVEDNLENRVVDNIKQYKTYTGYTSTNNIIKLDVSDWLRAKATVIDLEHPETIEGVISLDDNHNIHFKSNDGTSLEYVGRITDAGKKIEFVSSSGSMAGFVGEMELDAVQTVEDFEDYSGNGVMYYTGNTDINNRSGMRGAYYCEYYNGTSETEWGGSGWSLMGGSGDQASLKTDGGHTGGNYGSFKHAKSLGMRYLQWGLFDGSSERNSFRGKYLSFWAKTGGTGYIKQIKVKAYSQTTPRNATKDTYMRELVINKTEAIGEWEHFELELNPKCVYYGYYLFMEKFENGSSEAAAYLYVDDVEIYTASPYATFEAE